MVVLFSVCKEIEVHLSRPSISKKKKKKKKGTFPWIALDYFVRGFPALHLGRAIGIND